MNSTPFCSTLRLRMFLRSAAAAAPQRHFFPARGARLRSALVISAFIWAANFAGVAAAGTLTGTVTNGTTGLAVANPDVILIQLQGGMHTVGTFKGDAQGRFRIEHAAVGQEPLLVRVVYRGVNYHANVPPGKTSATVEVYESTSDTKSLDVESRLIAFQPNGNVLIVGEQFSVHNHSNPKMSVFNEKGNFEFELPAGGEVEQVSAAGPSGMPLVLGTIDKGNRRQLIAFAFRPGESSVRVSYKIPYATNSASLTLRSPYAAKSVLMIAPPTMEVQSQGFAPRGQEQGWNVFGRETLAAGAPLAVKVSGTAPPPSPADAADSGQAAPASAGASFSVVPQRLENVKWILIVGLSAMMAVGGFFLWRKPVPQLAGAGPRMPAAPAPVHASAQGETPASVQQVLAQAQHEAQRRLEEIKERLVRVEMRKQAGTISDEEYARERAAVEAQLREYLS